MSLADAERVWADLDEEYRAGVIFQIAEFGEAFKTQPLPDDVLHMGKRCLLDALGCAIGGWKAPGRAICEQVAIEHGGRKESTIFGSGAQVNAIQAAMVNAFMVRYLDYNDLGGGGHNSDAIPALLAIAETEKASGEALLRSIILSYELGARWMAFLSTGDMMADYKRVTTKGWCPDVRGGLNMPPALGLLMAMDPRQVANAIGATIVRSLPSNHLDANDEEFVMAKNLRFGHVACDAILSCRLARKGFTGPLRAFEGEFGYDQIINDGPGQPAALTAPLDDYLILETSFKPLCVNYTTQAGVQSTIALCKEHDIDPDEIEAIKITCCAREARHTTYKAKKYPRNGESADHSLFFANAVAAIERRFGPESFAADKFRDPRIHDMIDRISFAVNEAWPGFSDSGSSEITLKDGTRFEKTTTVPYGHHTRPMSDTDLEHKFAEMARVHMDRGRVERLIDTIWTIEACEDASDLARQMVFDD